MDCNPHKDIIYIAVTKEGISSTYADIAYNSADDPDEWSDSDIWHSYNHYYDPVIHTGNAPNNCMYYAVEAKTYYDASQLTNAYTNLGYSSHYLSDVGNPLHTGYATVQALNKWVHNDYESYVYSNWKTGHNFKSVVENNNNYYTITSPSQATIDLASYSNSQLADLFSAIFYYPDTWENDPDVKTITEDVLLETAKYNRGLVKYMRS